MPIARKHLLPDPLFFRCIFSGRRLRRCPPHLCEAEAPFREALGIKRAMRCPSSGTEAKTRVFEYNAAIVDVVCCGA